MPTYGFVPDIRPRITEEELMLLLGQKGIILNFDYHPIYVIGIRGYYLNWMGIEAKNDRGIYDDAIFIVSKHLYKAFNGNTDPARFKEGYGFDEDTHGIASLNTGIWNVYQLDFHKPEHSEKYFALCQRGGNVTVTRDGIDGKNYEDTGNFGINIHRGGYNKVSSLGCQTIYPEQWNEFIDSISDLASGYFKENWKQTNIPYVLIEKNQ
jgi:hypothetical protein